MEIRLGAFMLFVGVGLFVSAMRRWTARSEMQPQGGAVLLVAAMLIATGALGLLVGSVSRTEVGIELLSTAVGICLFIAELRGARSLEDGTA
jgi:hypothetical protein